MIGAVAGASISQYIATAWTRSYGSRHNFLPKHGSISGPHDHCVHLDCHTLILVLLSWFSRFKVTTKTKNVNAHGMQEHRCQLAEPFPRMM